MIFISFILTFIIFSLKKIASYYMISLFAIDADSFKMLWNEATLQERLKIIWSYALCTSHEDDLFTRLNQNSIDVQKFVHSHLIQRNYFLYEINVLFRMSEKYMFRSHMNKDSKL